MGSYGWIFDPKLTSLVLDLFMHVLWYNILGRYFGMDDISIFCDEN
jgi:hypothetical protein